MNKNTPIRGRNINNLNDFEVWINHMEKIIMLWESSLSMKDKLLLIIKEEKKMDVYDENKIETIVKYIDKQVESAERAGDTGFEDFIYSNDKERGISKTLEILELNFAELSKISDDDPIKRKLFLYLNQAKALLCKGDTKVVWQLMYKFNLMYMSEKDYLYRCDQSSRKSTNKIKNKDHEKFITKLVKQYIDKEKPYTFNHALKDFTRETDQTFGRTKFNEYVKNYKNNNNIFTK